MVHLGVADLRTSDLGGTLCGTAGNGRRGQHDQRVRRRRGRWLAGLSGHDAATDSRHLRGQLPCGTGLAADEPRALSACGAHAAARHRAGRAGELPQLPRVTPLRRPGAAGGYAAVEDPDAHRLELRAGRVAGQDDPVLHHRRRAARRQQRRQVQRRRHLYRGRRGDRQRHRPHPQQRHRDLP